MKVGIRGHNLPSEIETDVLYDHIFKLYGNHTPAEIQLAFDMALSGKLDLATKDVKCYEDFSCLYFSTIMNAYRSWAKNEYRELVREKPKQLDAPKELTLPERQEWINEWIEKENVNVDLIPASFFSFLVEQQEISPTEEEINNQRAEAAGAIKLQLISEHDPAVNNDAYRALQLFKKMEVEGFTGVFKDRIITKAEKTIVNEYFAKKRADRKENV